MNYNASLAMFPKLQINPNHRPLTVLTKPIDDTTLKQVVCHDGKIIVSNAFEEKIAHWLLNEPSMDPMHIERSKKSIMV